MSKPLNPKQRAFIKVLAKKFFVVTAACAEFGIDRGTYYDWLDNPNFKKQVDKLDSDLFTVIEDRLKASAIERQPWAVRFFLSRRHPQYKQKIEVSEGYDFDFERSTDD